MAVVLSSSVMPTLPPLPSSPTLSATLSGRDKFLNYYRFELSDDINGFKEEDYECQDVGEFVDEYLDNCGYTEHQKRFFDAKAFVSALIDDDNYDVYRNSGNGYLQIGSNDLYDDCWSIYMTKVVEYGKVSGNCIDKYYCRSDYNELYIIKKID